MATEFIVHKAYPGFEKDTITFEKGDIAITNDLTVSGDLTATGAFTFGDLATDTFTVTGKLDCNGDVDLGSGDDTINIGSGSGDTVALAETITVATDKKIQLRDTGIYINSGADGKMTLSADGGGADDITLSGGVTLSGDMTAGAGDYRIDLSASTVAAANTDGGLIKAGTSAARVVEDTADMKFVSFYFDDGATSGDARGIYNRLYITGAGGGGESLRSFTTVEDVAGATAHGAHISLNFNATGSITGLGIAGRNTIHVPDAALSGGTYSALQAEVYADGSSSDVSGATQYSFLRVIADGDATGKANVDANANFIEFAGVTAASGTLINTDITTHTAYAGIPIYVPGVGVRYLAVVSA